MKKASIDNQTRRSFNEFPWEQLIINSFLVINISATNAEEKTTATKTNKNHISLFERLSVRLTNNRPLHALMGIMGNQGKITKKQSCRTYVFLYISVVTCQRSRLFIFDLFTYYLTRFEGFVSVVSLVSVVSFWSFRFLVSGFTVVHASLIHIHIFG